MLKKNKTTNAILDDKKIAASKVPSSPTNEKQDHASSDPTPMQDITNELAKVKEQLLRAQAELENQRRRSAEEVQNAHKYASGKFATDLLGVKDALEMALADQSGQFDALKMGVALTLKELATAFEKASIVAIDPAVGEMLDPHRHYAISAEKSTYAANSIIRVMQKGYAIADRILRPAMVIVSKGSNNPADALENTNNSHDLVTDTAD